ncbi:MAG: peptide chain release factor N(5)-glutamine methyltransferase [Clostridia bacterium]|nr:peptide chain release factor N(5)-glutamine methyltransferase [Clostridia bacterium]
MVIDELVRNAAAQLTDNARFEAEQIVMKALDIDRTQLLINGKKTAGKNDINAVNEMLVRRKNGEPLQYILGECEFMSLPFYVESGVLIPRADTETLVETVIEEAKSDAKILDICSGSGCIGISLAHYIKDATVTMLDISDKAMNVSEKNIALNGVQDRVTVKKCDILNKIPQGKYDVIVSNPPYIETAVIDKLQTEVKDYEPRLALDGGGDGLVFYRRITDTAPQMLNENGILALEIGFDQGKSVSELMKKNFEDIKVTKDLAGNDRVVIGRKR